MGRRALGTARRTVRTGRAGGAAGAAVLLCAAVLTGCGGAGEGYLATGTGGGASVRPVPPRDGVELVPLDGESGDGAGREGRGGRGGGGDGRGDGGGARPGDGTGSEAAAPSSSASSAAAAGGGGSVGGTGGGTASAVPSPGGPADSSGAGGAQGGASTGGGSAGGGGGSGGTGGSGSGGAAGGPGGSPSSPPTSQPPTGPAALTAGDPEREPAEDRWCEYVTVALANKGGAAVTAGTITFRTHVIDALGIDWATVETKGALPVPIGAGASREQTWLVCLEAWRVPLGMHVETRDVALDWT